MKGQFQNDLNILASGVLGLTGVFLLLIPSHLQSEIQGLLNGIPFLLGFLCFGLALLILGFFIDDGKSKYKNIIEITSSFTLAFISALFFRGTLIIEGIIILVIGCFQILPHIKVPHKILRSDLMSFIAPSLNLFAGLFLLFVGQMYQDVVLSSYRIIFIFIFFSSGLIGAASTFYPSTKAGNFIYKLQAVPWAVWSILFILKASPANVIAPLVLTVCILFGRTIPWHRFILPEHDILGRRLALSAGTVEMAMLIFFTPLLVLIDQNMPHQSEVMLWVRESAFLFFALVSIVVVFEISTVLMTINGLMTELAKPEQHRGEGIQQSSSNAPWSERLARYLKPFTLTRDHVRTQLTAQADQISILARQLNDEKQRNKQLILLHELSQQLENHLDQPVSAQLAVNTLERALNSASASLYLLNQEEHCFSLLAVAGGQSYVIPIEHKQDMDQGALGRAVRQRKTQVISDTRLDRDYIPFNHEKILSCAVVPMIYNGYVNGVIEVADERINAFGSLEIGLIELVAAELNRAWERSGYQKRLTNLIQSGSQLSAMVEPETTASEVAAITRDILQARFVFVHIQLGQEQNFVQTAYAGDAPELFESLKATKQQDPLVNAAFHAAKPFRVRDLRKYSETSYLNLDNAGLRSMLAIPIRWHNLSIGAILAFGKQNEVFFSENDESLAELLSIQAAGAFESTWLQQELRASLRTTSLLYRLSTHIIQAENLQDAARDIAQTAHKLGGGQSTGIILYSQNKEIEAELEIDEYGIRSGTSHPIDLINQVMESGQLIYESQGKSTMRTCLPIQTPIRKYGALWINTPEDAQHKPANPADLQTLVNQAAIALERSLLLVESRNQAAEIKTAYDMLEITYDQTLISLTSALDARDRETEGHSARVSLLAAKLGKALNFNFEQLKLLERGSLLHDIGKIGISDTILHKPGPLNEAEWKLMRQHPDIGARIVRGIPFLEDTIPLIRHHQERWDGSGYPFGLKAEEIPILARVFSVVDAFDALTSNRPYRQKISSEEAIKYLRRESGSLFDPEIVEAFAKLVLESPLDAEPAIEKH